ncbi:hypothetical protein XENOCAPTIV_018514, partial [Xenoophorus captivus]
VSRAEGLLLQAQKKLKEGNQSEMLSLLEEVFILLPHWEPRPPFPTAKFLSQKLDLCQLIRDVLNVSEMTMNSPVPSCVGKYRALRCSIEAIPPSSAVFHNIAALLADRSFLKRKIQIITTNFLETQQQLSLCVFRPVQIQQIVRVGRAVELQTFQSELGNIKPLLHSSSPSNFVGILSRGLLLPRVGVEHHGIERTDETDLLLLSVCVLQDDEYLVYSPDQVKIKYVVQFRVEGDQQKDFSPIISLTAEPSQPAVDLGELQIPLHRHGDVIIFQKYTNQSSVPIEAKYVFPLDDSAAVCGFEAFINGKHVVGQDVFTISVGNLPPGATVLIRVTFVSELVVKDGSILFSLPGSVAPWQESSALNQTTQRTDCKAVVSVLPGQVMGPDGFQLSVTLSEVHLPRMWVENHPDKDSQACMLVFYPDFEFDSSSGDSEVVLLLDTSESMRGESFHLAQKIALQVLGNLKTNVRINIVFLLPPSSGVRNLLLLSDGHIQNAAVTLQLLRDNASHSRLFTCGLSSISVKWQQFNPRADPPLQAPKQLHALFNDCHTLVYGFVPHCTQGKKAELKSFIIDLSKEFSILSQFTSFVAIEERDGVTDIPKLIAEEDVDFLPYISWPLPQDNKIDDVRTFLLKFLAIQNCFKS